jgi:DNA-binding winged helix-turn-helix (wHTH) protein
MMDRRSFPDDLLRDGFLGSFAGARASLLKLVRRPDLKLGNARIGPALRTMTGPEGIATLEPRMMQVLITLADAQGEVVTRDELIMECWDGQVVGDDAINRAISGVRKAGRDAGADFQIETISKAGYRLTLPVTAKAVVPDASGLPRRAAIATGLAALAGLGLWAATRTTRDPAVAALVERGRLALRDELPDSSERGIGFLREAVMRAPEDAEAWGLLAVALAGAAEYAPLDRIAETVRQSEQAASRALALDGDQANARAALVLLRPTFGDWYGSEQRMRALLASAPDQASVWSALAMLMQGVGRCREAVRCNERAAAIDPLSPVFQYRLAYQEWSSGRLGDADQRIDRAMQLWPRHPGVWYARMLIFGLSGRPRLAMTLIDKPDERPSMFPPQAFAMWRRTLAAIDSSRPEDVEAATQAILKGAARSSGGAVNAILMLSGLGATDPALRVAEGYLLRRGSLAGPLGYAPEEAKVNDQRWRKTMMLFLPVTAPMRADPRFARLVEDLGMADYWRRAGVRPDYQLQAA